MNHVAIMKKSWGLIPKILSGEKTIESRWYVAKRSPWNKIFEGDIIYFKNSGEKVEAKAFVKKVHQFNFENKKQIEKVIKKYSKEICLIEPNINKWGRVPKYAILMELKNPTKIKNQFNINKKGFGSSSAWISIKNIRSIKI